VLHNLAHTLCQLQHLLLLLLLLLLAGALNAAKTASSAHKSFGGSGWYS
jgi:hypothetical protein